MTFYLNGAGRGISPSVVLLKEPSEESCFYPIRAKSGTENRGLLACSEKRVFAQGKSQTTGDKARSLGALSLTAGSLSLGTTQ